MKCLVVSTRSFVVNPLRVAVLAVMCANAFGVSAPAQAGLMFGVTTKSGATGSSSNSLNVTLANTGTTSADDISIAGFSFEITAAGADVTFSNVSSLVNSPAYVFAGHSLYGPDITFAVSTDGHTISASDNYDTPSTDIVLAHGQTVSLGLVGFSLSATAPISPIDLTFSAYPATGVNDSAGTQATVGLPVGAQIVVTQGPTSVPEPSAMVSFGVGLVGLLMAIRNRPKAFLAETIDARQMMYSE